MNKKWPAWLGLLLVLVSGLTAIVWGDGWIITLEQTSKIADGQLWRFVESNVGITLDQALIVSLIGFVLGIILILSWWRRRLQQEDEWWEERDEPLRTWPPAGM